MKRMILRFLALLAILVPTAALSLPSSEVAQADVQSWSSIAMPTSGNYIVPGIDVVDVAAAADGQTVYAVTGATDGGAIYRSLDGGATWTRHTISGVTSVTRVATSSSDSSYVAIITNGNHPYVSGDGGTSWSSVGELTGELKAIAISPLEGTSRFVAVAGNNTAAKVWIRELGGLGIAGWIDASVTDSGTGWNAANFTAAASQVLDLQFSPNFATDHTLAALVNHSGSVGLSLANLVNKNWNGNSYQGWGSGATVVSAGTVQAASLALDPTFVGDNTTVKKAYAAVSGNLASVLFRLDNTIPVVLSSTTKWNDVAINAAGDQLVVGGYDTNDVGRVANPATADDSSMQFANSMKRPGLNMAGVNEKVVLTFAGSSVCGGTSGPESAVSISSNGGQSFTDVGLVDTTFVPKDFAVTSDGNVVYIASYSATSGAVSLWRKATTWKRVLAATASSGATDFLLRLAPENSSVVFLDEKLASGALYYTDNGGTNTWSVRFPGFSLSAARVDLVAENATVLYALAANGRIYKTIDAGFLWDGITPFISPISGATLTLMGPNSFVVGGSQGEVAYSTNGTSWTSIPVNIPTGVMQATADSLSNGGHIYAASSNPSSKVYRFTIGADTEWAGMLTSAPGYFTGIALGQGGLYALSSNSTGSTTYRTTIPASAVQDTDWDFTTPSSKTFADTPRALTFAAGKLWAINQTDGTLETYTPAFASTVTTLPADSITGTSALLHGRLDTRGTASTVNVSFEYWAGTGTHTTTPTQSVSSQPASFEQSINSLTPGVTYYFKAKAVGDGLTGYGADTPFTTPATQPTAPTVTTAAATSVTGTSATLNGNLTNLGSAASASVYFEYRLGNTGGFTSTTPQTSTGGTFSAPLSSLTPNATYQFLAKAAGDGTGEGELLSFYTDATSPSAVIDLAPAGANSSSVALTWAAPGDDWTTGTATQYDIRYMANTYMSESYWSLATQVTGEPIPQVAGTSQSTWVYGLSPSTTYYFAMKTADEAGNWSAISNIAIQTTSAVSTSGGTTTTTSTAASTVTTTGFTSSGTLTLDSNGATRETVTLECAGFNTYLYILAGTRLSTSSGTVLTTLEGGGVATLPDPPAQTAIILSTEFGPSGATFSPTITLTMGYDPNITLGGFDPAKFYIAFWNGSQWVAVPSVVDTQSCTVTAQISHFTQFALIASLPTAQTPASFTFSGLEVSPQSAAAGNEITVTATVTNTGSIAGNCDAVLNINGVREGLRQVSLDPSGSVKVKFVVTKPASGVYQVQLGGLTGAFTITGGTTPLSATPASSSPPAVVTETGAGGQPSGVQPLTIAIMALGFLLVVGLIVLIVRSERARASRSRQG